MGRFRTRTASGAATGGSGTNSYTLVESGDALVGSFSQSETGTDRYGLVEAFDNVANDASGNTPGNVNFHGVGLPFRDPTEKKTVATGTFTITYNRFIQPIDRKGKKESLSGVDVWIEFTPNPGYVPVSEIPQQQNPKSEY